MKKIRFAFIPVIVLIISVSIYLSGILRNPELPEVALVESFNRTGAEIVSSEIYFRGSLKDNKYKNMEQLKKLAADFSTELGIEKDSLSGRVISNDVLQEIEVNGVLAGNTPGGGKMARLRFQLPGSENKSDEGYISVDITQDLSYEGLDETRKKVEAVFRKFGISPKVNSCITGSFDGKLSYQEMNDISRFVFEGVKARKVEGLNDKNLISVSAYSPQISNYIKVSGKKVNLNLALRYNSFEDRTYIWLATPVITIEY